MNNTNIARLRLQINTTIQEDIRRLAEKPGKKKSRFSFKLIARQLSQLFCNIHNSKTTFQLMILYWCSISIYYFGLLNSESLNGNHIKIVALFGVMEVFGVNIGEKFIHSVSEKKALIFSLSGVLIFSLATKYL